MMIKAEIASEMIRSRTQTPIPVPVRTGAIDPGSEAAPADGVGAAVSPTEFGSENVPGMFSYCIQNHSSWQKVALNSGLNRTLPSSRTSGLFRRRVTITNTRGNLMTRLLLQNKIVYRSLTLAFLDRKSTRLDSSHLVLSY